MNYADQNLSSVKTVAGENTNKKENEQQNAAIVSNSNANNAMEATNHQSSIVPQAGANETALGNAKDTTVNRTELTTEVNNDAEQMDVSTAVVLLTLLGDKLTKRVVKYSISYLEAKAAGLKVAFFKANRDVNRNHIVTLWKSVKDSKKFVNGCYVVPLRPILEKFNNIEVEDLNGNQITLDTPDLDMYVAVYDGQHRISACEFHPGEVDVDLDLNEFDGIDPLKVIKDMNFYSRNWNGQDLRDSNVNSGISTNRLYKEAKILQERYRITPKLAEFINTFVLDATKKRDLIEGRDTTMYNEDNAKRGVGIFEAYLVNFNGDRVAKKIELIEQFKGDSRLFVAGSSWGPDEDLIVRLANENPTIKFIVAPHEMEQTRMAKIEQTATGGAVRYTKIEGDIADKQILILDTIGMLSSVYGYADFSYIGGGFGVGIHNTLEAATFGLPIAFGPNYQKFKEARDMIALGGATSVSNYEELSAWFAPLRDDEQHLKRVSQISKDYTTKNQGATDIFFEKVFGTKK